jgi:hypothetical protein
MQSPFAVSDQPSPFGFGIHLLSVGGWRVGSAHGVQLARLDSSRLAMRSNAAGSEDSAFITIGLSVADL